MVTLSSTVTAASDTCGGQPSSISIEDHINVLHSSSLLGAFDGAMAPSRLHSIPTSPAAEVNKGPWKLNDHVNEPCVFTEQQSTMQGSNIATITAISTILSNKPLFSSMCADMKLYKRNPSPLSGMRAFKKPRRAHEPLYHVDVSDVGDAPRDDKVDDKGVLNGRTLVSKKIASERNGRYGHKQILYSLKAVVPATSKGDIRTCKARRHGCLEGALNSVDNDMASAGLSPMKLADQKILELDVSKMEEKTYQLKIHCKKAPGLLVQLTRTFEALDYEITNAMLTSVSDHIFNTVVMKVRNEEVLEAEELKSMLLKVASKFGLSL